jgi:hypothetical protein
MTEPLNRDEIIALLDRLGGDDDADVLAAARALHIAIADAGTAWADLLVPEDAGDTGAAADTDVATVATDLNTVAEAEVPAGKAGRDAGALALIDKLLARPGVTEAFRREMEGYRHDIAEGAFEDADHRYLGALHKRLSGGA